MNKTIALRTQFGMNLGALVLCKPSEKQILSHLAQLD